MRTIMIALCAFLVGCPGYDFSTECDLPSECRTGEPCVGWRCTNERCIKTDLKDPKNHPFIDEESGLPIGRHCALSCDGGSACEQ